MKKNYILNLLLIPIQIIICWRYGANELKIKPKGIDISNFGNKRRLASQYRSIRIFADYSNLRTTSGVTDETVQKVRELIDETSEEFNIILMVTPISSSLSLDEDDIKYSCELDSIGSNYQNYFLYYDLVIFPTFDSTLATNTLAAAGMCLYLIGIMRPIFWSSTYQSKFVILQKKY